MMRWLNTKVLTTLPVFIAANICAVMAWSLGQSSHAVPLILGVIAGSLVDLDNRLTGKLQNLWYTLLAFSVSSFLVQFAIGEFLHYTLLMMAITFLLTMAGAIGQRYSTIAFGSLLVAFFTTLSYTADIPWYLNPLMILVGTTLYSLIALIIYLLLPNRPVQEKIALSFSALGEYLDSKSCIFDPDEIEQLNKHQIDLEMKNIKVINAFNQCRTTLFYRIRGQHRPHTINKMMRYYFAAQDIHERVNSTHFNYQQVLDKLKNSDLIFRIQRLLELQAHVCRQITRSLHNNKPYHCDPRIEKSLNGILQSFELHSQKQPSEELLAVKTLIDNLQSINWQLRQLEQGSTYTDPYAQIHTRQITGFKNIMAVIFSHFTFKSQLFRHAMRLTLVVLVCCLIIELFQLHLGYWILITAVFVCQPNYSATKNRLKQRIIGTFLGVIVGALLPYLNPILEMKLGLLVMASCLNVFFRSNYALSVFFITLQVMLGFELTGLSIQTALLPRLLDTLIAAGISWLAVSYLWPDWKYLQLNKVSRQAIKSEASYLLHITSQLQFGKSNDLKYRIARRNAHEYSTALSDTLANMNSEPKKYAKYLGAGFELLKLNSSLLSYISALGSYRNKMKDLQQSTEFLASFYPISKKVIYALENIEKLRPEVFEKLQQNIETALKKVEEDHSHKKIETEFMTPFQQLNLISHILPPLYQYFQQNDLDSSNQAK